MKIRQYIPDHAVTTIPVLALLFAVHYFLLSGGPADDATPPPNRAVDHRLAGAGSSAVPLPDLTRLDFANGERQAGLQQLFDGGEYPRLRTELLKTAADAVGRGDQGALADSLLLLGEVAIEQQELPAAETYLKEALAMAIEQGDAAGAARSYGLLGKLNIRARELAREAANTYDDLWQARNAIARGLLQGVDQQLRQVIDDNLAIRRYGAAADAWEAMASLHDSLYDGYQASLARIEAIRLFASTGQGTQVNRLLEELDRDMMSADAIDAVRRDADRRFAGFLQDQLKAAEAHDYRVLYYRSLREGDRESAWKYRIKSSESMAGASERVMFQRQAEIIAVLYNSNFAMARARQFLDTAGNIYDDLGATDKGEQLRAQQALVY